MSRNAIFSLAVAAAIALSPGIACAQGAASPSAAEIKQFNARQAEALKEAVRPSGIAKNVGGGTFDRAISVPSGIEFTATQGSADIALKASNSFDGGNRDAWTWTLTAKAALDDDGGAPFGSLRGLSDGASVELNLAYSKLMGVRVPDFSVATEATALRQSLCKIAEARYQSKNDGDDPPATLMHCDENPQLTMLTSKAVREYAKEEYEDYAGLYFSPNAGVFLFGVTPTIASEKFDYLDPASFAERDTQKTNWSVGAYLAYVFLDQQVAVTLRGDHQRIYKALDQENRCDSADPAKCVDGVFGPPKAKDQDIVSLELRKKYKSVGFAVTAEYDVGEDDVLIDVPLYFVYDEDKALTGGVRATWNSEDDEVVFGLFVSQKLCLVCTP